MTRKKSSCEAELDILTKLPTEMPSKLVVLFPAGNSEVGKKKVQSDFWFRSTSESLTAILSNKWTNTKNYSGAARLKIHA